MVFLNKEGKEIQRVPCQVFTRVMGYIRPIANFNPGKKSEYYSRKNFKEWCECIRESTLKQQNQKFIENYGVATCE